MSEVRQPKLKLLPLFFDKKLKKLGVTNKNSNNNQQQSPSEFVPTFLDKNRSLDSSHFGQNGFLLKHFYLPEEILQHILSFLNPRELLSYSLVCRNWNKLIKSDRLWVMIYERKKNRKAKKLPWYLFYCFLTTNYFDTNLLANTNNVEHWRDMYSVSGTINREFALVRKLHTGSKVLSITTRQLVRNQGFTGRHCYRPQWLIKLRKSKLLQHILDVYKPHISLNKWGSMYELNYGPLENHVSKCTVSLFCETQRLGEPYFTEWLDLIITQYPEGIEGCLLEQMYWNEDPKYSKRGSVKFLFDSIEPIETESKESKKFSRFEYISEIQPLD